MNPLNETTIYPIYSIATEYTESTDENLFVYCVAGTITQRRAQK